MIDPSKIDWDRAFDVLHAQKIPDWDKELVALGVTKAVETWTNTVDKGMEILSTEIAGDDPFPHKIDIVLEGYGERLKIVDWKTKQAGELDDNWTLKLTRSKQFPLYAAALASKYDYDIFPLYAEIRGVLLADKPKVRTISRLITRAHVEEAMNELRMAERWRQSDLDSGLIPWFKDPQGCRAFGPAYKCEEEEGCWGDSQGNVIHIPVGDMSRAAKPFSYSSLTEYRRCPERYRRMRVLDKPEDEDTNTGKGNAFHAVMEQIYSNLKLVSETAE